MFSHFNKCFFSWNSYTVQIKLLICWVTERHPARLKSNFVYGYTATLSSLQSCRAPVSQSKWNSKSHVQILAGSQLRLIQIQIHLLATSKKQYLIAGFNIQIMQNIQTMWPWFKANNNRLNQSFQHVIYTTIIHTQAINSNLMKQCLIMNSLCTSREWETAC